MKIRNGFVSNSSSSSFVVVFPKKPKNADDVLEFMFAGKEGGVGVEYYDEGLSYRQVADKVFMDIDLGNAKKGTLEEVIDVFSGRYHYYSDSSCSLGGNYDEHGGRWAYERDRYCGFDKKLMEKYRKLIVADEEQTKKNREEERRLIKSSGIKELSYTYAGGTNPYTKKPYTKEEIEDYKKSSKAIDNFKKTNKEFLAFEKKHWATSRKFWDKQAKMRKEIAAVDAKNFFEDNKGKYIFVVCYGDEAGEGIMEHGRIFRNVPHVHINQH